MYIHDAEFEADFVENDYDEDVEMSLGERLSIMMDEYYCYRNKSIEEYDDNYVHALFRDMADLLDDCDEEFYNREVNFLMFKLLNTPIGHEYMRTRPYFTECWKIHGEELMINIDMMNNTDPLWETVRSAILDFMYDAQHLF